MIRLEHAKSKHFYEIDLREEQAALIKPDDRDRFVKDILLSEHTFTLMADDSDKVLAIGAFNRTGEYTYYAWLLITRNLGRNAIALMHCCKRMLELHRGSQIEVHVMWNDVTGRKYAELFGFEEAETLKKFYNGYDVVRYVKNN